MGTLRRFFGKRNRGEQADQVQPPVDLNKPVTNPDLSLALSEFAQRDSRDAKHEVMTQLRRAVFLVPMLTDGLHMTPTGDPGRVTIQQGSLFKLLSCTDDTGSPYLPLFTDWAAIRAWTDRQVSTLVMPAADAWRFVLSHHYAGAIVNPGERGLPMSRELIEFLRDTPPTA